MENAAVGTGKLDASTQTDHTLTSYVTDSQIEFNPLWHVFNGAKGKRKGIGAMSANGSGKVYLRDVLDRVPKKPLFYALYSNAAQKVKYGISSRDGLRRLKQHGKYWDDAQLVAGLEFQGKHSKLPLAMENKIKAHFGTRKEFMSPVQLPSLMAKIKELSKGTTRENFKVHRDRIRPLRPRDKSGRFKR